METALAIIISFAAGTLIAFANYRLSRYFLMNKRDLFVNSLSLHFVFSVLYLVALYFVSKYIPLDRNLLLVGGALGVTLPNILFVSKLIKLNDSINSEQTETKPETEGKE